MLPREDMLKRVRKQLSGHSYCRAFANGKLVETFYLGRGITPRILYRLEKRDTDRIEVYSADPLGADGLLVLNFEEARRHLARHV